MALQDNLPQRGGQDWDIGLRNALDQADAKIAEKAPAQHSHGAGGEVVGIGTSDSRPAVADGYIFSETDTGQVLVLKADGNPDYQLAARDKDNTFTAANSFAQETTFQAGVFIESQASAPATAAGQGAIYAKTVDGSLELFFRGEDQAGEIQITKGGALMASPKSIQEVNATITVGGTGNKVTFAVALATAVDKSKSVYIPNAGTGSYAIASPLSSQTYWFRHWGTKISADGTSLEVEMQDGGASGETVRIAGYVVEYY